jgi:NAD(P)-dependent dehydrogenase (short-subunit alcohol dehydrogenase family)/acyl carrier protein
MGDAQALRPRLRQGGIYLITGGSGNIGLAIAEYLSLELGAKVILTGRSTLPSEEEWDQPERDRSNELCRRAQAIKSLRDKGAHIYYYMADVADLEQMSDLIEDVEERFGALNGVIHSAGRVGRNAFRSVGETTRRECEMQFAPKVEGVRVLDEVLRGRDLDFCLLNSSVSTILGGLGFLAYSAANNYMDTFAQRQSRDGRVHWISLNWDAWLFGKTDRGQITTSTMAEIGLTPADGVKVFQQALSMGLTPQLIVSTGDLHARIDQWVMLESLRENEGKGTKPSGLHARPSLPNAYVAPSTEVERVLAEIWQELLGIEQIGVYDNFFELGGHSLLAVRLVSRLSEAFQIDVPLRAIFEFPTVSDLALLILERQAGQTDDEMLTEMLEELERLSAEEAVALLNEGQLVRDYE